MEISRKQFQKILAIVENDVDKADAICTIIEEANPAKKEASVVIPVPVAQLGQSTVTVDTTRSGFGKDVRSIGGVTE